MPTTPHPKIPPTPKPTRILFDPYNSSSTGHQVDKSLLAGTTIWRDSRTHKLTKQFADTTGGGGEVHVWDRVGEDANPRASKQEDIRTLLYGSTKRKREEVDIEQKQPSGAKRRCSSGPTATNATDAITAAAGIAPSSRTSPTPPSVPQQPPQIFAGLTIYINGCTAPLISDYNLKHLFAQHGGSVSLGLARRKVTHVILGETNLSGKGGCGGGLAAGKMQREITRVGGKGVKYVTARWVADSVERGRRVDESRYYVQGVNLGARDVRELFKVGELAGKVE